MTKLRNSGPVTTNAIEGRGIGGEEQSQRAVSAGGYGTWSSLVGHVERLTVSVQQRSPGGELRSSHGSFSFEKIIGERSIHPPDPVSYPPMLPVQEVTM
jgi:hypothetical protein